MVELPIFALAGKKEIKNLFLPILYFGNASSMALGKNYGLYRVYVIYKRKKYTSPFAIITYT